jgi:Fe-S oxidoreductase
MIEQQNAKEEIIEIVEKCNKCGLCREFCHILEVLRNEENSPRAHAILMSKKIFDKNVFDCSLCKACEENCPLGIKLCTAIKKAREILSRTDKEPKKAKFILKRILDEKNPYKDEDQ